MSTLLEQASLIMIPSGYKEDVVYSVIPENGNGDLAFTRASDGTRVNSAGLVEVCPWNLLTYSEDFTNGVWVKTDVSITANSSTAPNGTTTADLFTTNNASGSVYRAYAIAPTSGQFIKTISAYFKYTNHQYAFIVGDNYSGAGQYAVFDLINGTNTFTSSGYTATISSVGDGWFYCTFSGAMNTDVYAQFGIAPFSNTYAGFSIANGKTLLVWGAQLNIGSTANPYFPTTDRLNVPRLTYQNGGGGCPSLLLEKQSTNLVTYSEDFSNVSWLNNGTIVVNQAISPDGTQNADLFYAATGSVKRVYKTVTITSSTVYSVSVFAKASGKNFIFITDIDNSNEIWFNLSNGTFTSPIVGTASMVDYGNGWYKCSYTTTSTTTTGYAYIGVSDTSGSFTFTANGTDGVYIWGCQMEASSYPTSYIPTTSSSATRVADACYKTGISSLIGQTEGVIFVDINRTQKSESYNVPIFIGSGANLVQFYFTSANVLVGQVYTSAGQQVGIVSSALANGRYKIALAYASNDFAMYINGTQIGTDTSGTVPTCSQLYIGNDDTGNSNLNDSINQAILFPTRLTNAELASLTTI